MSTAKAAAHRHGRRGGGWIDDTPTRGAVGRRRKGGAVDPAATFHPDTIAQARAHTARCRGANHTDKAPCPARPTAEELDGVWAGRARMAAARLAADVELDEVDRQALARHPLPAPHTTHHEEHHT